MITYIWAEIISVVVFGLVFGAALTGLVLQRRHPAAHREAPTMDAVRLVMGVLATMSALVLGLLIANTDTYFETQQKEVQELAADVVLVDAWLARYGPETNGMRQALRGDLIAALETETPDEGIGSPIVVAKGVNGDNKGLINELLALQPKTDTQHFVRTKAVERIAQMAATRLKIYEETSSSIIPTSLVFVMIIWLMLLFFGFGLYAPNNRTVLISLGCGSFAVASALYLIIEMSQPYKGLIHVSDRPLRESLRVLGMYTLNADKPPHADGAMIQSKRP